MDKPSCPEDHRVPGREEEDAGISNAAGFRAVLINVPEEDTSPCRQAPGHPLHWTRSPHSLHLHFWAALGKFSVKMCSFGLGRWLSQCSAWHARKRAGHGGTSL